MLLILYGNTPLDTLHQRKKRYQANQLIDSIITIDPLFVDSREVLEQLYPRDSLTFIEDIERILLEYGANTRFDIENSDWFHH